MHGMRGCIRRVRQRTCTVMWYSAMTLIISPQKPATMKIECHLVPSFVHEGSNQCDAAAVAAACGMQADQGGTLDRDEVYQMCNELSGVQMTENELDELMTAVDIDGGKTTSSFTSRKLL